MARNLWVSFKDQNHHQNKESDVNTAICVKGPTGVKGDPELVTAAAAARHDNPLVPQGSSQIRGRIIRGRCALHPEGVLECCTGLVSAIEQDVRQVIRSTHFNVLHLFFTGFPTEKQLH